AAIGLDLAAGARLAVAEHDGFVPAHHRQHETRRAGAEPQDRAAHGGRVFKNDIAGARARRRAGEYERETRGQAVRSRGHGTLDKGRFVAACLPRTNAYGQRKIPTPTADPSFFVRVSLRRLTDCRVRPGNDARGYL